jgi:ABC-type phosphate/phosphonate transport system, permease component
MMNEPAVKKISVFEHRKKMMTITLLVIVGIYVFASLIAQYDTLGGIASVPKAMVWFFTNLVPTPKVLPKLPDILSALFQTALVSVAVTVTAAVIAFLFSLAGSNTTRTHPFVRRFVRIVAAFFRNVPDVVWAILLLFSFGQNVLTGFFALFFTTFGMLTRTFIETIDEVSPDCVEALEATGANFMHTVFQGIIPASMSEITTWILFMIETNIRSSTLIGILTGTGIGFLFDLYYKRLDYASASLVVISIVVLVIGIELVSGRIRKVIM